MAAGGVGPRATGCHDSCLRGTYHRASDRYVRLQFPGGVAEEVELVIRTAAKLAARTAVMLLGGRDCIP